MIKRILKKAFPNIHKPDVGEKVREMGIDNRIRERLEPLNKKATANPQRTAVIMISLTILVSAMGMVMTTYIESRHNNMEAMGIQDITPVFNGFQKIQNNDKIVRKEVGGLVSRSQEIVHETDSLRALPHLTHRDSMKIIENYYEIKRISKLIKIE
nr:hypothetical protein [Clostridia bacterium]